MYQYFVKVVPTVYNKLTGQVYVVSWLCVMHMVGVCVFL
jgi:hypothetical protein